MVINYVRVCAYYLLHYKQNSISGGAWWLFDVNEEQGLKTEGGESSDELGCHGWADAEQATQSTLAVILSPDWGSGWQGNLGALITQGRCRGRALASKLLEIVMGWWWSVCACMRAGGCGTG